MEFTQRRFELTLPIVLGIGLILLGYLALSHVVNNFWPIDEMRVDLIRQAQQGRATSPDLLAAINLEILVMFFASLMVMAIGVAMPIVALLNKRFAPEPFPHFLIVLRQSMWVGIWVSFCVWLQIVRAFGVAIAVLVAAVLLLVELFLQVRARAKLE